MFALAIGIKPLAIVLLPFLCLGVDRTHRRRVMLVFAACAIAIFLPAMCIQHGYLGWLESIRIFSRQWEANGSIYELIKSTFGQGGDGWAMEHAKTSARLLGATMLLLCGALLWHRRASFEEAGYWIFLILLLFSPVVYPWYLLWMLCFAPLLRGPQGRTGLVFSGTVAMSYVLWHLPQWVMPGRMLAVEYLPVYAVLLGEILARSLRLRGAVHFTS